MFQVQWSFFMLLKGAGYTAELYHFLDPHTKIVTKN